MCCASIPVIGVLLPGCGSQRKPLKDVQGMPGTESGCLSMALMQQGTYSSHGRYMQTAITAKMKLAGNVTFGILFTYSTWHAKET